MSGSRRIDQIARRQFVKLSGVASAGGLLTLAGADGGMADGGDGSPQPPPPNPGGTACPTPSALCGYPTDTGGRFDLWDRVQVCLGRRTTPPTSCLHTTSTYVVLNGAPPNTHNYLLVPTCRVKGIECPFIATTAAPNYWLDAWINAQPGQPSHVVYPNIGLGINSADARQQDQLHIHLAGIQTPQDQPGGTGTVDFVLAYT